MAGMQTKNYFSCRLVFYQVEEEAAAMEAASLEIRMSRRSMLQLWFVEDNTRHYVVDVEDIVSPVFSSCVAMPPLILASPAPSQVSFVAEVLRSVCRLKEEEICAKLAEEIALFVGKHTPVFGLQGFYVVADVFITSVDFNDTFYVSTATGTVTPATPAPTPTPTHCDEMKPL